MFVNRRAIALVLFALLFAACKEDVPWEQGDVDAYVPVYNTDAALKRVEVQGVKPMVSPGKMYGYGQYLVIPDPGAGGLHVIDNSVRTAPVKRSFISIPGCAAAEIKSHYLYIGNYDDLVTIDLASLPALSVTSRVSGAFQQALYPPYEHVYFQCVDTAKGTVIGWRKATVKNPKCRT